MHEHFIKGLREIINKQKEECHICYNLGHNILHVVVQIRLTATTGMVISSIANYIYELSHELSNDLSLRILGYKKVLGKPQIWVGT